MLRDLSIEGSAMIIRLNSTNKIQRYSLFTSKQTSMLLKQRILRPKFLVKRTRNKKNILESL